jgi:tRNA(Ile)-lysidine synthetase-like protein
MLHKLRLYLEENFQDIENKKLLLATSGGLDSMVMVHLFQQLPFEITLAHCNFQLRGMESFGDQNFVQEYAQIHSIPLAFTQFDTVSFAKDYKMSTQVAARELRYNWFYELLDTEGYDFILTAHHADDNLETFLINITRGTGLDGLIGIPQRNDRILRPLLCFSRDEIKDYAEQNNILWREDSSNASDKYLRNRIRHNLVPLLKELNPNFLTTFQKTQCYLQESKVMVEDATIMIYQQIATEKDGDILFDLEQLLKLPNYKSYLYQWLNEFGFTAWDDIYDLVESQTGKQVFSNEFRLLKNRDTLILSPKHAIIHVGEFLILENQEEIKIPLILTFCKVDDIYTASNETIFVDENKLEFPLVLRKWNEGDIFHPFGMKGKSKRISKLFKDEKLSLLEKENIWLLCSNNQIVWVVGLRQDERFKIKNTTKSILKIQLQ